MPMYDYKCEDCGQSEEYLLAAADETDLICVHCGGASHRQLAGPGLISGGPTKKFHPKRGKHHEA